MGAQPFDQSPNSSNAPIRDMNDLQSQISQKNGNVPCPHVPSLFLSPVETLKMTDQKTATQRFQKLLVARYSPQNECFAQEGDTLYAPVSATQRVRSVPRTYHFLSVNGGGERSKFGWVKSAEQPFSIDDFVAEHSEIRGSDEQTMLLASLFSAIANLAEGTPVAGSYFLRGVEQRRVELTFHKVFLYLAKKADEASIDP